ncbi:IclR family transcriptional regulator [Methylobacterium sp. J-030]|uniref:IclR family transcriptional regulator n=1 Tax=Methylobacterium sp. J-030 TaxID=2836627 RepID=UPI001FBA24A4|nr:IclR family transcriptional regulator [Methylobacterium sp. J-030]MCJ2072205.1 IclR family transcriptional regulator [Methylobacterium sp. J-030]
MSGKGGFASEDEDRGRDGADAASTPSGTLLRGLEVLEAFRAGLGGMTNTELVAATELPKATVSRLTRALVDAGYLTYEAGEGKYRLSPRVLNLGFSYLSNLQVLPLAHEHMQQFAKVSGCSVSLAAPDGVEMIYLDRCSGETLPYFFSTGSRIEVARTATGHAYLAGLAEDAREALLVEIERRNPAAKTQPLRQSIGASIREVREKGYCHNDRMWRRNVCSIAAPMASRDGRTVLAVNCVAPAHVMDVATLEKKWSGYLLHLVETIGAHF